jgi:hypothetical protein
LKYDWKKNDKQLYLPKNEPSVIDVPAAKYYMISGKGNPNHADFEDAVGVLYSLSYTVKMLPKGFCLINRFLRQRDNSQKEAAPQS